MVSKRFEKREKVSLGSICCGVLYFGLKDANVVLFGLAFAFHGPAAA